MIDVINAEYQPALFLHIQNTAGTVMVNLAKQFLGRENVVSHNDFILHYGLFQMNGDANRELDLAVKSVNEYSKIPFVSGYFGFEYAKPLFDERFSFTFLRDPIDRILSFYYSCIRSDPMKHEIYRLAQSLSLIEFLNLGLKDPEVKSFIWNNQTWQLANGLGESDWRQKICLPPNKLLSIATDHLQAFSYIGFVETFEQDRDFVLKSLNMPIPEKRVVANVNTMRPVFEGLPKAAKDLLFELTNLDRQLYNIAWSGRNVALRRYTGLTSKNSMFESSDFILEDLRDYYLNLMQQILTGSLFEDASFAPFGAREFDHNLRENGLDWPERAKTMIGEKRLANLRELICIVLKDSIPGDFIETGVWRGGACILMRAILLAYGDSHRKVWLADSFAGLPPGNEQLYSADADSNFHTFPQLAVSLEEVKENFINYGLLDEQVKFIKGWFKDTLPTAPITKLALIRLDGDMYESTMDALQTLYPRLSKDGYVIVDDYHVVPACKLAVHDYFSSIGIDPKLHEIDGVGVYWKKTESDTDFVELVEAKVEISVSDFIKRLNQAIGRLDQIAIKELLLSLNIRDARIVKQKLRIESLDQQLMERDMVLADLDLQLRNSFKTIAEIHESSSWKLTFPIRKLFSLFRKQGNRQ